MSFDLDENGNVKTCPVLGWTAAPVAGIAVLLRLEYATTPAQLKTGGEAVQVVLTPQQAQELAALLTRQASNVLQSQTPPHGNAD